MKRLTSALAAVCLAGAVGATAAQAHTPRQCKQELKTYSFLCKFSPTAWLSGMCKNDKVRAWCDDRKEHDRKFHDN